MSFLKKIKSPVELVPILDGLRAEGKKIVLCHGAYDLYHCGHLYQFEQARGQGDILVVSVTTDRFVLKGPGRPVFSQNIRAKVLAALELVDFVTFCDTQDSTELIKLIKPDVYVKGTVCKDLAKDPSSRFSLEKRAVEDLGGRVFYSHEIPIHATPLLSHYIDPYPEEVLAFLDGFKKKFPLGEMARSLEKLKSLRVMVIGESIIDQYDFVQALGLSPKGGVVAMKYLNTELFAGGILACANHIANFCSNINLITTIGSRNSHEEFIANSLATNVRPLILTREGLSTIIKQRQIDPVYFRKYSETYVFDEVPLTKDEEGRLVELLRQGEINKMDLVLVNDYGHGLMTEKIVRFIAENAPFLSVSTQANSANRGLNTIDKYPKADFVCLDHFEASLALRDQWDLIRERPEILRAKLGAQVIAVTLGHRGSVVANKDQKFEIPIFSKRVIDTVGAGDTFYSLVAPCIRAGLPIELCGFIGNAAAALATTYLGNKTFINQHMLLGFIETLIG